CCSAWIGTQNCRIFLSPGMRKSASHFLIGMVGIYQTAEYCAVVSVTIRPPLSI
ncbi:hypothetical protein, partial [Sideroxydans sp. CL21]